MLRSLFWKNWYNFLAFAFGPDHSDITFMNYGFLPLTDSEKNMLNLKLLSIDRSEEFFSNLYHTTISDVQDLLKGSHILEVGAGRGGGASFISRYFSPESYVGLDFSETVVELNNIRHKGIDRLSFQPGNAENIPFPNNSFDFVLNVESSHCYSNITKFFLEVHRVLKPNGYFLMADFRIKESMPLLFMSLKSIGWGEPVKVFDITANVFAALEAYDEIKRAKINNVTSLQFLRKFIGEFAGVSGGKIYESFRNRATLYHRFVCRK